MKIEYSVKCQGYIFKHYLMRLLYGRTGSLMINAKLVNMISKKEIMLNITRRTYGQKFLACFVSNEDLKKLDYNKTAAWCYKCQERMAL